MDKNIVSEIISSSEQMGIDPATILALAEIESGGRFFHSVNGRQEPAIRFEGHYFDRRLNATTRKLARDAGISSPVAGRIRNPSSQQKRWELLARAMKFNYQAALESTSWGIGQVMGAHWQWLSYNSIDDFVKTARSGAQGQIELMLQYIIKADLIDTLSSQDWRSFARRYNGPNYAKNQYDLKLEASWIGWKIRLAHEDFVADAKPVAENLAFAH